MSLFVAAFLWCVVAVFTGAAGIFVIFAGLWELGSALLLLAAISGRVTYLLYQTAKDESS